MKYGGALGWLLVIFLAVGLTTAGCGETTTESKPAAERKTHAPGSCNAGGCLGENLVTLHDGRKITCITYAGKAVSCDWVGAKQ